MTQQVASLDPEHDVVWCLVTESRELLYLERLLLFFLVRKEVL